ncbi:MAG: hypothetical protein Q4G27_01245 [Flavobacteriaceae bacterium]|nr:hypothetical protein [Flavobacteriaceae bacterium]
MYDAIWEHDNKNYIGGDVQVGIVEWLKETEPTEAQWREILK